MATNNMCFHAKCMWIETLMFSNERTVKREKEPVLMALFFFYLSPQTRIIFEFTRRLIRFAVARLTFMFSAHTSIGTPAARYSNKVLSSGVKFASARNLFSSGTVKSYTFNSRPLNSLLKLPANRPGFFLNPLRCFLLSCFQSG